MSSFSEELGLGGLGGVGGGGGAAIPSQGFGSLGTSEGPQGGVGITQNSWNRFREAVRSSTPSSATVSASTRHEASCDPGDWSLVLGGGVSGLCGEGCGCGCGAWKWPPVNGPAGEGTGSEKAAPGGGTTRGIDGLMPAMASDAFFVPGLSMAADARGPDAPIAPPLLLTPFVEPLKPLFFAETMGILCCFFPPFDEVMTAFPPKSHLLNDDPVEVSSKLAS